MRPRSAVLAAAIVLGSGAAAWIWRAPLAGAMRAAGLGGQGATPDAAVTFKAAGVHKCVGAHGTSYRDDPCPAGTREAAASGGTVTVTSFPKAAPAPPSASSVLEGLAGKPLDPGERQSLRGDATDRP